MLQRDAVIGLAFDSWMIRPGWVRGKTDPQTVCLADAVDHIDRSTALALNSDSRLPITKNIITHFQAFASPSAVKSG